MGYSGSKEEIYHHSHRKVPYRSERLEISKREKEIIDVWLEQSIENISETCEKEEKRPKKIIFDTDIGTDIDDSLALLLALHLPKQDIDLLGITTVYGWTTIRTAVAQKIIQAYNENNNCDIPVVKGESVPLGTHRDIWHSKTEGMPLFSSEEIFKMVEQSEKDSKNPDHAAPQFIISQADKYPGELELVCLGALTNVAYALRLDPNLPSKIKKITYMGMGSKLSTPQTDLYPFSPPSEQISPGKVYTFFPNHNISADTMASYKVFESGIPIYVINDIVTNKLWFGAHPSVQREGNPIDVLINSKEPETKVVGQLLETWLKYRSGLFFKTIRGTCPHDGITLAEAVYPSKFVDYVRGNLLVHEWAGFSTFVANPKGPHCISISIKEIEFLNWFTKHLLPDFELSPDFFEKVLQDKKNVSLNK